MTLYFDFAATTPLDSRVTDAMMDIMTKPEWQANASTQHQLGLQANQRIQQAADQVAASILGDPAGITWTSGATESINLALMGAMRHYRRRGKHLITWATEHQATLATVEALEKQGCQVTLLVPQPDGRVCLDSLKSALQPDTVMVSLCAVNNETGVYQDIPAIAKLTHDNGSLLHVDGAQMLGKLPIDVEALDLDYLSLSSHKAYGPKGVGILYCRQQPNRQLAPLMHGGHQQRYRPGTLPTHQIVGMGKACEIMQQDWDADQQHIQQLAQQLQDGIQQLPITIHGDCQHKVPHIWNFNIPAQSIQALATCMADMAYTTASACHSAQLTPSHVLSAMGVSEQASRHSLRISLGKTTTASDISTLLDCFTSAITA